MAGVILIILGISGMTFLRSRPPESREMIRINDRIITTEEFEREYSEATSLYNHENFEE